MNYEILSIDRAEEHEKLIRENGALREKINRLEEQHEKHMQYAIRKNYIIEDLREQTDKARKILEDLMLDIKCNNIKVKTINLYLRELSDVLEEEI